MIALMYHDIVDSGRANGSGFAGADANHYKLTPSVFLTHLELARARNADVLFTFDDGGISALEPCADLLDASGIKGLFFIPTDYVGRTGFCSAADLRILAARGHVLGSHSASHPIPISKLSDRALNEEWSTSRKVLEDIIGAEIADASVPGGFTSERVEHAAASAGFGRLFTSVPTKKKRMVGTMSIHGRFAITRATASGTVARVLAGESMPWIQQAALWEAKKLVKLLGGPAWLRIRQAYFRRVGSS